MCSCVPVENAWARSPRGRPAVAPFRERPSPGQPRRVEHARPVQRRHDPRHGKDGAVQARPAFRAGEQRGNTAQLVYAVCTWVFVCMYRSHEMKWSGGGRRRRRRQKERGRESVEGARGAEAASELPASHG